MSQRFSRRSAGGYYKPLASLTNYGIGTNNGFTNSSLWTKVVSTDPFNIIDDSHIETLGNDFHGDFFIRTTPGPWGDSFSSLVLDGATNLGGFIAGGGIVVRHNGLVWAQVGTFFGYYFQIVWNFAHPTLTTVTWEMGKYGGAGTSISYSASVSGSWNSGSGPFPSFGDVFLIKATGSSPVTVTVLWNGASLGTFVDTINVIPTGLGGIFGGNAGGGHGTDFMSWSNWQGGPLNPVVPIVPMQKRGSGIWLGVR